MDIGYICGSTSTSSCLIWYANLIHAIDTILVVQVSGTLSRCSLNDQQQGWSDDGGSHMLPDFLQTVLSAILGSYRLDHRRSRQRPNLQPFSTTTIAFTAGAPT